MARIHYTVASLFCGCGGLDLGFHEEGFRTIFAVDNDPAATAVFKRNLGTDAITLDIRGEEFHDAIRDVGSVDIVLGGFPCQGFSKAGPKRECDERNGLYREMLAAVEVLHPTAFVAENVDGMSQNFNGRFVDHIVTDFEELGYQVQHRVLDAVSFGVPQHRRRIIFVGMRSGHQFEWPRPTHHTKGRNGEFCIVTDEPTLFTPASKGAVASPLTIRDAIEDIRALDNDIPDHVVTGSWPEHYVHVFDAIDEGQKLCNVRHAATSVYTWDIPKAFGRTTKRDRTILETIGKNRRHKRYGSIPNGNPLAASVIEQLAGLRNIQPELDALETRGYLKRVDDRFDLKGAMFCSGLFKRPNWDEPSPTVLTNFHNPRYFLHPSEDRPFSLRECARLQGFPDDFLFLDRSNEVSLIDAYRLVGNAVPPPLARALAQSIQFSMQVARPQQRCVEAVQ